MPTLITVRKDVRSVSTNGSQRLRECPFCGGEAVLHPTYDMDTGAVDGWFAWCDNDTCECKPETGQFFTEAEAIAAWNVRADYHGYEQAAIEAWKSIKTWNNRDRKSVV